MNFLAPPNPELDSLLEQLLEDRLDSDGTERLNFLLKSEPQARDRYLLYIELHSSLLYDQIAIGPSDAEPGPDTVDLNDAMIVPALVDAPGAVPDEVAAEDEHPVRRSEKFTARFRWLRGRPAWVSAAALVLISIGVAFLLTRRSAPILVATVDASWGGTPVSLQTGDEMPPTVIELTSGLCASDSKRAPRSSWKRRPG